MARHDLPRNALVKPRPRGHARGWRARSWWPWARRAFTLVFFAAVTALLARYASQLDWSQVLDALRTTPASTLALALALAAASHVLYSCFDLIGRRYTGHRLAKRKVMVVTFVSYAFNLCIGSVLGGVGFRLRLYSRLGLKVGVIMRIVSMSLLTNWLGYKLLAGLLFIVHPLALPPAWHLGRLGLQSIGVLLVAISLGYIAACVYWGDHNWTWRGHEVYLPPWRMALLQYAISAINWCLMAAVIWVLIDERIHYADVLTVLLIGAIAGVIAHVPAGLGVFEFVFVALLSHAVSEESLVAALLGYRAVYYVLPLIIASLLYLGMEVHARHKRRILRLREGEA